MHRSWPTCAPSRRSFTEVGSGARTPHRERAAGGGQRVQLTTMHLGRRRGRSGQERREGIREGGRGSPGGERDPHADEAGRTRPATSTRWTSSTETRAGILTWASPTSTATWLLTSRSASPATSLMAPRRRRRRLRRQPRRRRHGSPSNVLF